MIQDTASYNGTLIISRMRSNGNIFDDLERPLTQIPRTDHSIFDAEYLKKRSDITNTTDLRPTQGCHFE